MAIIFSLRGRRRREMRSALYKGRVSPHTCFTQICRGWDEIQPKVNFHDRNPVVKVMYELFDTIKLSHNDSNHTPSLRRQQAAPLVLVLILSVQSFLWSLGSEECGVFARYCAANMIHATLGNWAFVQQKNCSVPNSLCCDHEKYGSQVSNRK